MQKALSFVIVAFYVALFPAAATANEQDWMIFNQPKPTTGVGGRDEKPAEKPLPPSYVGKTVMPASFGRQQWKVHRVSWTTADEVAFGDFLRHIGESNCKTTHECLTSPLANPKYHASNPPGMQFFADCADLPYILRAYFAWMNGLPYSFSAALDFYPSVAPLRNDRRGQSKRAEFASFAVTGRRNIVPPGPDAAIALSEISNIVSTNHFRHPAAYKGRFVPDYYPVAISKETVKPGVVIFDPLGHIAVVYKVTDDGEIHFIDAHPDNALTRGTYGSEVDRAGPESGAGIKAWRPQRLVNYQRAKNGAVTGGEVALSTDSELPGWSDEQYYGVGKGRSNDWKSGRFSFKGDDIDYHGFVRFTLARDGFRYDPVREAASRVRSICQEFGYRLDAVEAARKANIDKQPQPPRLPNNIYVTQGYWEAYATPSRDAQLKNMFVRLREEFERYLMLADNRSKLLDYSGTDLKGDLLGAYKEAAASCSITYSKSDGTPVVLGFKELKKRLFAISFDPHHCVERRWGATDVGELASCRDDVTKSAWYAAQQRLRNQLVRTIGDRMDFTLDDLKKQARDNSDVGENDPPDIDIEALLKTAPVIAKVQETPVVPVPVVSAPTEPLKPQAPAAPDLAHGFQPALITPAAAGSGAPQPLERIETSAEPKVDATPNSPSQTAEGSTSDAGMPTAAPPAAPGPDGQR